MKMIGMQCEMQCKGHINTRGNHSPEIHTQVINSWSSFNFGEFRPAVIFDYIDLAGELSIFQNDFALGLVESLQRFGRKTQCSCFIPSEVQCREPDADSAGILVVDHPADQSPSDPAQSPLTCLDKHYCELCHGLLNTSLASLKMEVKRDRCRCTTSAGV